jgi:hypothetical protein
MVMNSMPELEGSVLAQPTTLGDSFYAQLQQACTEATNNSGYSSDTVGDIVREIPAWGFASDHGQEVLNLLLPDNNAMRLYARVISIV